MKVQRCSVRNAKSTSVLHTTLRDINTPSGIRVPRRILLQVGLWQQGCASETTPFLYITVLLIGSDAEYLSAEGGGGIRDIYRNVKEGYEDLVDNIVRPER
jgi:hypothetical protein